MILCSAEMMLKLLVAAPVLWVWDQVEQVTFRAVYGVSGDPPAERPVRAYTRVMALLGHAHNAVDLLCHYQGGSPPPADRTWLPSVSSA